MKADGAVGERAEREIQRISRSRPREPLQAVKSRKVTV